MPTVSQIDAAPKMIPPQGQDRSAQSPREAKLLRFYARLKAGRHFTPPAGIQRKAQRGPLFAKNSDPATMKLFPEGRFSKRRGLYEASDSWMDTGEVECNAGGSGWAAMRKEFKGGLERFKVRRCGGPLLCERTRCCC